jgi:hypothetical protein
LREKDGIGSNLSFFFHDALQGVLMLARVIHDLRNLHLGDFVSKDPAFADPMLMHMKHYALCLFRILIEVFFQHGNDKLHRRVIVVQEQDAVHARMPDLRLWAGNDNRAWPSAAVAIPVRVLGGHNWSGQSRQGRAEPRADARDAVNPNPQLPEGFAPHHLNLALQ